MAKNQPNTEDQTKLPADQGGDTIVADQGGDTLAGGDAPQFADGTAATEHLPMPPEVIDPPADQGGDTLAGGAVEPVQVTQAKLESLGANVTLAKVRTAIEMIEGGNNSFGREALQKEIVGCGGFVGRTNDISPELVPDNFYVGYLGIEAISPVSLDVALTVWCSKARRVILAGIYDDPAPDAPAAAE